MGDYKVKKTIEEINEKIRRGEAVVVTAEEMVKIVREVGPEEAAREVDVVTTGTFSPMCSSGAFINFGHPVPTIKAYRVWLNGVPAYAGLAAVDIYIGATEPAEDDPLNKVFPGEFRYGGGHVIHDLVAGKKVHLRAIAYGTHCYPRKEYETEITLKDLPYAVLCNPRNAYQNYNCAINLSEKTLYTYMGVLRPHAGNANYATAGQLSPLLKDPYLKTIGIGTRIFLGGAKGYVVWAGTQHRMEVKRTEKGAPLAPAATLMVLGNLKEMDPRWVVGTSHLGYGCSLAVGLGIPIPVLNEEVARFAGLGDDELFTQVVDYAYDYPNGIKRHYGIVSYAELKSGKIKVLDKEVPTVPISSYVRAREIAEILKRWIQNGEMLLTEPVAPLPGAELFPFRDRSS
ncbi:hypothetical protein FVE67_05875 [Thermosulfurimonas marina]|uniref:Homocysteine biosynthesis enzyme sulfur-incorporation domain-containing protein n=1 Tax=Thermosulfurimonas marina TaxID=2047767 RepID=A0A6H1WT36_9BACT|nr:homocysteine biosynthesis protein [Thermosulfurimonas marina]QJA06363.1 hypothetical protein FVE67_05875 [Thermosulfurimonas marina]